MDTAAHLSSVSGAIARVNAVARHHRLPLTLGAFALFAAGAAISLAKLDLNLSQIDPLPLIVLFVFLSPLTLLHAAAAMLLLARCAGVPMRGSIAFRSSAFAVLAEMLPIPGGAIVRAGALIGVGGKPGTSTLLVTGTAILWISLAACGAGIVLMLGGNAGGIAFLGAGLVASLAIMGWLVRLAGWQVTVLTLLHRLAGLLLIAVRLQLSFAAVHAPVSLAATLPFALATIAGTAASIAPGGLGISEALAALIATATVVLPAAALLAVALNRLVGLFSTAVVAIILEAPAFLGKKTSHV